MLLRLRKTAQGGPADPILPAMVGGARNYAAQGGATANMNAGPNSGVSDQVEGGAMASSLPNKTGPSLRTKSLKTGLVFANQTASNAGAKVPTIKLKLPTTIRPIANSGVVVSNSLRANRSSSTGDLNKRASLAKEAATKTATWSGMPVSNARGQMVSPFSGSPVNPTKAATSSTPMGPKVPGGFVPPSMRSSASPGAPPTPPSP